MTNAEFIAYPWSLCSLAGTGRSDQDGAQLLCGGSWGLGRPGFFFEHANLVVELRDETLEVV